MSTPFNDPIGAAILAYEQTGVSQDIEVTSDICEDDVIPSAYLFRSYAEMPPFEKLALDRCKGKVLDVGAGAGIHAAYLKEKGFDVTSIDTSEGAVNSMQQRGLKAECIDFEAYTKEKFDTLLILMNGLGLAGRIEDLPRFLKHAASLLNEGGKILCDSTDIQYLYEDEEGAIWMDLNASYYGNVQFQMKFDQHDSGWFNWLYIDPERLELIADENGFACNFIYEENDQYLVELTRI